MAKIEVRNRWTGNVQFTAETETDADDSMAFGARLGLAVKWAYKSGADLSGAVLRDADLRDAVLSGAVLSGAVLSGAVLSGAVLRGAVLSDADLRDADLSGAVLRGADLRDADLRGAVLRDADLSDAVLSGAVLSGAEVPAIEALDSKILAAIERGGKLDMGDWHKCETTHCRAGWAITLAGEAGAKLEAQFGPAAAGALLYAKAYPELGIPNFYATNADAMEDIRARAALDGKAA